MNERAFRSIREEIACACAQPVQAPRGSWDFHGAHVGGRTHSERYIRCGHCGGFAEYHKRRPRARRWRLTLHATGLGFVESFHATLPQCVAAVREAGAVGP